MTKKSPAWLLGPQIAGFKLILRRYRTLPVVYPASGALTFQTFWDGGKLTSFLVALTFGLRSLKAAFRSGVILTPAGGS